MPSPSSSPAFPLHELQSRALRQQLLAVLAGTLFLALSSYAAIPMWPVPITLQTFAVSLIGALIYSITHYLPIDWFVLTTTLKKLAAKKRKNWVLSAHQTTKKYLTKFFTELIGKRNDRRTCAIPQASC
jgi:hypothetical protein